MTTLPETKQCYVCGEVKPRSEFYKAKRNKDGLHGDCKACRLVASKKWREKNSERKRENDRRWREANLARKRESDRRWRENNPERQRENERRWREQNPEKARRHSLNSNRAWRKRRPFDARAKRLSGIATRAGARGEFTGADLRAKWELQGGRCYYCGCSLKRWEVDHKLPLSRYGLNCPSNICLACPTCNKRKQDKTPAEFREYLA